jgi:tRNA A37 N6-isopentenylltransferase MiaA
MKKHVYLLMIGGMGLLLFSSLYQGFSASDDIPEEIDMIIQTSCFDCHNAEAKSEDAKRAVQFDLWDDYRVIKKIGILSKMGEVVEEDKMPPQKYLNNKPQAKLSETQKKQFLDWTEKESGRLMLAER